MKEIPCCQLTQVNGGNLILGFAIGCMFEALRSRLLHEISAKKTDSAEQENHSPTEQASFAPMTFERESINSSFYESRDANGTLNHSLDIFSEVFPVDISFCRMKS